MDAASYEELSRTVQKSIANSVQSFLSQERERLCRFLVVSRLQRPLRFFSAGMLRRLRKPSFRKEAGSLTTKPSVGSTGPCHFFRGLRDVHPQALLVYGNYDTNQR